MRKHFFLSIVLLVFSVYTFAQQGVVTGTVKAEDGSPLPGATVQIKGTTSGTVTDLDGNYSLSVAGVENPTLVFSYVGYLTEEVAVAGKSKIDMKMVTNVSNVEEVVVIGYGTQKKSLVTGSISKVNSEDLVTSAPSRVEQTLQGKTAGVTVTATSGEPGAAPSVRVRGISSNNNSAPIYIVDGIQVGGIDYLNPGDIESVEVLKDAASAAIYGAQGGNGVVYVTTKKGKSGTAVVTYDFYYGTQRYASKMKLLTGPQYVDYIQQGLVDEAKGLHPAWNDDQVTTAVNKQLANYAGTGTLTDPDIPLLGTTTTKNTDWIKAITSPAKVMEHTLRLSGGNDKTNYSGGFSYLNQDGITGGSKANFKRYTLMFSGENKATKWLTVGGNVTYSRRSRSSLADNSEFGGIYGNAILIDPLTPVYYANDSLVPASYKPYSDFFARDDQGRPYGMSTIVTNEIVNPVAQIQESHGEFTEDKILAGVFAQIEPVKGLTYKTSYNIDAADNSNQYWNGKIFYQPNSFNNSKCTQDDNRYYTWHFDNVLTYAKTFGKHSLTLMAGTHAQESKMVELVGYGTNMIVEDDAFSSPGSTPLDTNVYGSEALAGSHHGDPTRLSSIFGRLMYNYNEKYLFNFTLRQDASSMLAPGHQKGLFPSASVGWVISNEKFWSVPTVNNLKIRVSYGSNGNLSILSPFQYESTMSFGGYVYTDGTPAQNQLSGAGPTQLANNKLSWEQIKEWDGGLDMGLFNNKLNFVFDYYNKRTSGLLSVQPVPNYVGNTAAVGNNGTVLNEGEEFELSYRKMSGDFQWSLSANASFNKNKVLYFGTQSGEGPGANLSINGEVTHIKQGEPLYYMYGYKCNGVWKNQQQIDSFNFVTVNGKRVAIQANAMPGDIRIVDVNGDSTINQSDRTKIGDGMPKAVIGLNFDGSYKGFDLGINIIGDFGNNVYFGDYRSDLKATNRPEFMYTDAWSPDNENADFFRPTVNQNKWNLAHNSMFVRNGNFVKVKTVTLGYTIPNTISNKIGISKFRVYVSANNLLTITKYEGADPEIGTTGEVNNSWSSIGIDRGFYPQAREYLVGVNVTF